MASPGPAIVHCHGTPGGRLLSYELPEVAGLVHVSLDRPGFGLSDPFPGRRVADHAGDVERVLDHLGIERVSAFGWSGGGPHALGLGARLPGRVARVAVLGSHAPGDDPSSGDVEGMAEINVESYRMLREDPEADRADCEAQAQAFKRDPETWLERIRAVVDPVDAAVAAEEPQRARMIAQLRDAFQKGGEGWFEDHLQTIQPWGFAFEDVRVEVQLWHGELDRLVPVAQGRRVAGRLPRCEAFFLPRDGHISLMSRLPEIVSWLAAPLGVGG
jgi:pimeloyl-ACP methyl ester carboxylesterase